MKLHLGCGKRYLPGFTHIDIADYPHIDYQSGVDYLPFIEDSSIDEIYSSHTLEYFDRVNVVTVLKEWERVLKPGSQLFLTVPDFESLLKIYLETKSLGNIIGPLFGRWINPNNEIPIFHKTAWDENDLSNVLLQVGFTNIEKFDPINYLRSIDVKFDDYSLAYFPHMDRNGIQVSLALSAQKPSLV